LQATKFETPDARIGALHELVVLEEDYGVHPKPGETAAADLLAAAVPEEPRIHEARLAKNGLVLDGAIAPSLLSTSISILAASTTDAHLAASLQLAAALLLERSASENEHEKLGDALRRYHLALEGWPECLTAARGMRRLAERLGEGEALIEAAAALGNLETTSQARAERLIEAGTALAARGVTLRRAQDLFSRALAEDPDSARAAEGLIGLLSVWAEPGQAADALRAALDRTTVPEQAVRLGVGLARLAIDQLRDPTVALEALRRVRKKAPGHVPSLLSLAEACASLKLWTETAEAATGALGITRDAGERLRGSVLLAEAHAQVADTRSAARRETAEAEKLADGSPEALRSSLFSRIASIHRTLGDPAGAERALVRAVVYGPEDPAPMRALEELHPISLRDGALAHARALEQVLALAESLGIRREGAWLSALGRIEASALSRPREGLARIREAIRVSPARTESYELLTEVYGVLGAHDDAVRELVGLLGEATPASASPERALTILRLVVRECKLSRRPLQAATAEELIAYISRAIGPPGAELEGTIVPRAKPIAATVPAALSLSRASIESHLIPAEGRGPALELCTALSEVVPKLLRIDPFALGLSQRDRLEKRAPHPLRMIADRFARAFGDLRFDLYVDASSVSAPRLLPGDPAVIVLPRGYGDLSENEQAIGLSRLFVYLTLDVPWFDELGADDLDGLLVGARRVADERWGEGALSSVRAASAELWRPRIAKGASRKLKRTLEELAPRLPNFDPAAVRQALRIASFRGAYVLTGDIVTTLNHVLRVDRDLAAAAKGQRIHKMLEHPVTQDLLLYALSELPAGIRRQIGSA
jgi:tetratricopeptide (TPR) repeat protein